MGSVNAGNLSRLSQDDIVIIIVKESTATGSIETNFMIHKTLLARQSDYFKNTLTRNWEEAQLRTVTLTDVSKATFEIFVHWLYTKELPKTDLEWSQKAFADQKSAEIDADLSALRCVIFSDVYSATEFRHACEKTIIKSLVHTPAPFYESVILAFENLPQSSVILEAMVDAQVHGYDEKLDDPEQLELREKLPRAFLERVMVRYSDVLREIKGKTQMWECNYHEHRTVEEEDEYDNGFDERQH